MPRMAASGSKKWLSLYRRRPDGLRRLERNDWGDRPADGRRQKAVGHGYGGVSLGREP